MVGQFCQWFRDVMPLNFIDTTDFQQAYDLRTFDILCNRITPQRVCDIVHCCYDSTVSRTARHAAHELAIDLDEICRQVLQLRERTETGTEIIQ